MSVHLLVKGSAYQIRQPLGSTTNAA